jgi:hypothetical protein
MKFRCELANLQVQREIQEGTLSLFDGYFPASRIVLRARREHAMERDSCVLGAAALAAAILTPMLVAAQTPPKTNPPIVPKIEQLDPNACDHRATVGEGGELDTRRADGRDLSEQLAESGGVICPPSLVDPAIKAPTPPGGSMPVIPPPGSPGGDPTVQPK